MIEIKQKIISRAKQQLDAPQHKNIKMPEDYRDFLQSLANGLCPICKLPLEIIESKEDENYFEYKFECGHASARMTLREEIKIREVGIGLKSRQEGRRRLVQKIFQGYKSSGDPKLSEGIYEFSLYDRETDWIDKIVKDNKTGRILDEHHEPLTKHKSHIKRI